MPYPPKEKSVEEKIFPQNARNAQNLLAEKSLPQMSTDVHRLGGYGIPAIPTLPSSVYSVNSVGEQRTITICVHPCHPWEKRHSHRTHTRNLLAEKSLPQMSTELTEPLAEKSLPQTARMFTDVGGYGIPAIPTLPNSVFCWRTAHSKHLCKSVKSVGEKIFPQNARNAQKLLAEKSLPQMARMFTDVGGYGIPAIPTLPNSVGEQRTLSICVNL